MNLKRVFIIVQGIVQGVGFRPFVYNLAVSLNLKGWVNNNSEGVYIDLEGEDESINSFLKELKNNPPPLSRIEKIILSEKVIEGFTDFSIKKSEENEEKITLISPDMAICKDCTKDIKDKNNRRYRYPFTNCTNCGPRFSIIKSIPYDRDKTTMEKFKMCSSCYSEYTDPTNRRFHAQPNACSDCGPKVWVCDKDGNIIHTDDPIKWTAQKLMEGFIFAIKGLTGFHLACNAEDSIAVETLRKRKKRPYKPFAVMAKDMNVIKESCYVNKTEESLLTGIRKPIVLLNRKDTYTLPYSIAPNMKTLGVMLPYTPLHEILFMESINMLVMTSANLYGLPLEYENHSALKNLSNIADYFLLHNRDIYIPVDDSVVRVILNKPRMIRRARGYAPEPLKEVTTKNILALGPNMKNTFCISKDNFIFLSQHNGDLENYETYEHYKYNINHFKNIFSFTPEAIACDMHPHYLSTEYAESLNIKMVKVQHHHAHIVSCMVENNLRDKVIGLSFDGTGFGTDNKIWGSEFLICDRKDFFRAGHLDYISMPGGEAAVREPYRMAVSYLYNTFKNESYDIIEDLFGEKGLQILKIIKSQMSLVQTSSMGRLFDAVSSIISINNKVTYEGQASIELENAINEKVADSYNIEIEKIQNEYIIIPYKAIKEILKDKALKLSPSYISCKFHNTIINLSFDICCRLREETKINSVVLSGGVFQNAYLLENLHDLLLKGGFQIFTHSDIPSNDGGVSLGQIIVANENLK